MFTKIKQYLGAKTGDTKHLTDINQAVEECRIKMDIPGNLPLEIFLEILIYLSPRDLHSMWNCCRRWRNNMRMESFWKKKCMMEQYFECEEDLNSALYRECKAKYSRWQGIYMYNSKLEYNWIEQNCKEITVDSKFLPSKELSYFSGDLFIVTNNKDNTVWVIDSTTGSEKKHFQVSDFKYNSLVIREVGKFENRLIVVSEVGTYGSSRYSSKLYIKVWNIGTGRLLTKFEIEMDPTIKVLIYKDLVSVVTIHYTANIINITQKKVEYQRSSTRSVFHCGDKIAMGTDVGSIVIMNLDYTEILTINCFDSYRSIDDIQMKGKYLIGLSQNENADDFRASIWNIETKSKLFQVDQILRDELRIFENENRLLYLCGWDEYVVTMKYCHLDSGECIFTFNAIRVLSISHNYFILLQSPTYKITSLYKIWSIKREDTVSQFSLPLHDNCNAWIGTIWMSKSKLAYFRSNSYQYTLTIVNFEI